MKTSLNSANLARRRFSHTVHLLILVLVAGAVAIQAATTLASSNAAATVAPTSVPQKALSPENTVLTGVPSPPPTRESLLTKFVESLVPGDFKDWVALIGVLLAFGSFYRANKRWKFNFLTDKWTELIKFLQGHSKYMNAETNRNYLTVHTGDAAKEYEMVARLCIGYLDDMYFLGYKKQFPTWFRGSIKLLAGTHRSWLERNRDSYDTEFYAFLLTQLGPLPPAAPVPATPVSATPDLATPVPVPPAR